MPKFTNCADCLNFRPLYTRGEPVCSQGAEFKLKPLEWEAVQEGRMKCRLKPEEVA
ncbi:MAG: hypothetical protein VB144_11700 [Clostridia bacterium]|nr:hypothetical protein [Clostridia bacterium]